MIEWLVYDVKEINTAARKMIWVSNESWNVDKDVYGHYNSFGLVLEDVCWV